VARRAACLRVLRLAGGHARALADGVAAAQVAAAAEALAAIERVAACQR
jgi:hypothetical protein